MRQPKVFGIGLNKTGTTSLGRALNTLGVPTIHYPFDSKTYRELAGGQYRLSILEEYQGIVDTPVAPFYPQLEHEYPGSRFILTVRDMDSWLRSIEAHWTVMLEWCRREEKFRRFTEFISACVYGTHAFHRERFRYVYETHERNVREYFRNRSADLLVMDVCRGDGWDVLCPFLGIPLPGIPFPHQNKGGDRSRVKEWMERYDRTRSDLEALIPRGERLILVDDDQLGPEVARGREALPFPERGRRYCGPPADDATAIQELDRARAGGSRYIAFAWPAFWWFDVYAAFHGHLQSQARCLLRNDRLVVFDLATGGPDGREPVPARADSPFTTSRRQGG